MINKKVLFGLLILPYGGGNCLFGVEDKTTPLFRGNVAMVEVASADTNPTEIPNTGTWHPGALSNTKYFDISIAGKCETGSSDRVKLDVQPASEIPDFFTKNSEGKIVFAAPQVVGTVKAAKGHNSWVQIDLKTINGDLTSDIAKHVCLGIKKNDEDDFFDIIHAGHLTSRYVDVTQESYIELVPLLSKTATTESTGYVAVTPGTEVAFTDITVPTTGEFNFGSVYRVNVSIHDSQWLTDQACDLGSIDDGGWNNDGRIGVGPVTDQSSVVHENQLLAISLINGKLRYSLDGAHWTENTAVGGKNWLVGPVYGNGVWCAIADGTYGVKRSTDGGKTWSGTLADLVVSALNFSDGIFMAITKSNLGIVYTSPDAEIWTQVGSIKFVSGVPRSLIYGNGKWICSSEYGYIYQSNDGKTWGQINSNLQLRDFHGGCYVNRYSYMISMSGLIVRSIDGTEWKRVFDFIKNNTDAKYCNITYYKNKLWAFDWRGQKYTVGLFNPDGTIESLEN